MFGREDENELRLIHRGKYLMPDRNCDYFRLKRLMFTAGLNQYNGIRLLADSDQYDKVLEVAQRTICVLGEESDAH